MTLKFLLGVANTAENIFLYCIRIVFIWFTLVGVQQQGRHGAIEPLANLRWSSLEFLLHSSLVSHQQRVQGKELGVELA